jgi:hypothetical protein
LDLEATTLRKYNLAQSRTAKIEAEDLTPSPYRLVSLVMDKVHSPGRVNVDDHIDPAKTGAFPVVAHEFILPGRAD